MSGPTDTPFVVDEGHRGRERERWRELRAAAEAPRSPFMEPEFAIAVGRVRPRARVAVLYEGARPVGFLPYERLLGTAVSSPLPFDLDVHAIPARGSVPAHFHHDVRFLVVARGSLEPRRNAESRDLGWWTLPEARDLTDEPSMHRQFDKLQALAARL